MAFMLISPNFGESFSGRIYYITYAAAVVQVQELPKEQ